MFVIQRLRIWSLLLGSFGYTAEDKQISRQYNDKWTCKSWGYIGEKLDPAGRADSEG